MNDHPTARRTLAQRPCRARRLAPKSASRRSTRRRRPRRRARRAARPSRASRAGGGREQGRAGSAARPISRTTAAARTSSATRKPAWPTRCCCSSSSASPTTSIVPSSTSRPTSSTPRGSRASPPSTASCEPCSSRRASRSAESAEGKPFDPREHDAIAYEESDVVPEGTVLRELQRGYRIRDRILRPSLVSVAKGGPAADSDTGSGPLLTRNPIPSHTTPAASRIPGSKHTWARPSASTSGRPTPSSR